jgi:hypothetical protein
VSAGKGDSRITEKLNPASPMKIEAGWVLNRRNRTAPADSQADQAECVLPSMWRQPIPAKMRRQTPAARPSNPSERLMAGHPKMTNMVSGMLIISGSVRASGSIAPRFLDLYPRKLR